MPYRYMDITELSRFLGLDLQKTHRLIQKSDIPFQKVQGQLRFNLAEVTEWFQKNVSGLDHSHLSQMDEGMVSHRQVQPDEKLIVTSLLCPETLCCNLEARTKNSVLRELVALAQETGRVYDPEALLEAIMHREELFPTAFEGGFAIPHPRRPLPYAISEPILVIARVPRGIGFNAPDGRLTDLFFLTCSQDDYHHLHILARLCRMLYTRKLSLALRDAQTETEMLDLIRQTEQNVIEESL